MKYSKLIRPEVKDEYGLLHLQEVILNIMQYIDDFCKENDIEYYIIGGTALGAKRHGGFIPWDDDLDIAMTRSNYDKFCKLFREKSDKESFFFQEGFVDWPCYFSKVRLLGTYLEELEDVKMLPQNKKGIFVDIFPLDNAPDSAFMQYLWYFCGKVLVAHGLQRRGYSSASLKKKIIMSLTFPLYFKPLHNLIYSFVKKFNNKETNFIGGFALISRFKNTITPKSIWGKPQYVDFELTKLQAPADNDAFLKYYFGDYMALPPVEARGLRHVMSLDFGKY